jgi:hypothetical protein
LSEEILASQEALCHTVGWFGGVAAYATTPPNQPQRCILTDYFNKYNFMKLK